MRCARSAWPITGTGSSASRYLDPWHEAPCGLTDVDLLVVATGLSRGRLARVRDFEAVEAAAAEVLSSAAREGIQTTLSPVLKTPEEVQKGSLLFLDMVDQAVILYDRDRFLRCYLDHLKARLEALGARRIYRRGGYYWLLKPDLKPGEGITL